MLRRWAESIRRRRPPDQVIGGEDRPYLLRWYAIPRNPIFNIYLHEFMRSDDDRALHDHPWFNCSILLSGRYIEHTIAQGGVNRKVERRAGAVKLRSPWSAHRVELIDGQVCRTIFITGPRMRAWGFHCPQGWRHWRAFTAAHNSTVIGRGCE